MEKPECIGRRDADMLYGFIKVAAAVPRVRPGDTVANASECIARACDAAEVGVKVLTFPELCLTGATCGDLFAHEGLLRGAMDALMQYTAETAGLNLISVVGLPVAFADHIFNCAAVVSGGSVLGLVPKSRLSAAERRVFSPAPRDSMAFDAMPDGSCPILGCDQIFVCSSMPSLRIGVEIGADLLAAVPPSARLASAGATVICNPAALPELISTEEMRRREALSRSARSAVGYIIANSGAGESTTDYAFGGHALVAENGDLLAERTPFSTDAALTVTDLDTERLLHDRRTGSFDASLTGELSEAYFTLTPEDAALDRAIDPTPFIPADPTARAARCERILAIQSAGLATRVYAAHARKPVLGISGGLDSTLALLVTVRAMDALGRDRKDIVAVTMPCFGTTVRTKTNATVLCEALGVDFREVNIFASVEQHFRDIGHDPAVRDVTYENAQARERTQVLMDIANEEGGMVIGTGDLSELALGWATYNGDHMSMYAVNGGLPKTLIRHVVQHEADLYRGRGETRLADALCDVLATPVSPELLPADESGNIAQRTEDLVGPYELHDFFLYYMLRYGFSPRKLFYMAKCAWGTAYQDEVILHWLEIFSRRFFTQQFKRSCLPDGPAVFSVGVSPRAGLAMPSDAAATLWLREIEDLRKP